jgi:hypothetical protein
MVVSKSLLIAGAIINLLFGLFHVLLTWRIAHVTGLSEGVYGLLVALAVGCTLLLFFVAAVTAFCQREMLSTSMGLAVSIFTAVFYLVRVVEEFTLFTGSWPIAAACLVTGAIYVVLAARVRVTA